MFNPRKYPSNSKAGRLAVSLLGVALLGLLAAGCSVLSGDTKIGEGIVIPQVLKIRSSTAQVALDLGQAKRGDRLDILDHSEVRTPTEVDEWCKVRTKGADPTTGWVEARYIVDQGVVDKAQELFDKSKNLPAQGNGRLKVATKLRVEPGGEVATRLSRGTQVEIVGKTRTTVKPDKQNSEDTDEPTEEPEARTILWYQVRLPDTEILRAGWVGAQQVELDVPEEIMYLEGEGRRFTGWVVFDQTKDKHGKMHDNYIGLMKSLDTEGPIDFTRIWVMAFDPDSGRYNGVYIEDGLRGVLPVTLNGHTGFTINELDQNGKTEPVHYELTRVDAAHVHVKRITPKTYVKSPRRR